MIHPVILCGGTGSRLWPSSRQAYPKQFVEFVDGRSLFQEVCQKLTGPTFDAPTFLTCRDFEFLVKDQITALGLSDGRIILEPEARNTAPAVLAAALAYEEAQDAILLVAPSDCLLCESDALLDAVEIGLDAAQNGKLVTFGVAPDRPETGRGYLQFASPINGRKATSVSGFLQNPDEQQVAGLLEDNCSLWHTGLLLFRVADILERFKRHTPQALDACREALQQAEYETGCVKLNAELFRGTAAISIEDLIFTDTNDVVSVQLSAIWPNLDRWDTFHSMLKSNGKDLAVMGSATAVDCQNTLLRNEDDSTQLVGLGLKGIAAIATRDAILVTDMARAGDVGKVVSSLKRAGISQATDYPRFHRPWGWYETLCLGERFQVKRIMVKPDGILSLQSHVHRSEHWVVVGGTARVTVGDEVKLLSENEAVYIPLGAVHRLENPGKLPMYLIEVQTGPYLGEDDIVRYEDVYNRS